MDEIYVAKTKYLRGSARKSRLVADLIRGLPAKRAEGVLVNTNKKAAVYMLKTLRSAIANAEHNFGQDVDDLYVADCRVDESFTMKRGRPVSRGRMHGILKRTHNIIIGLKVNNGSKS